ncbi:MAG: aldo/keto reductase [Lachnospiraceae bacterium]|nr:aldo/keto reductase [Lachnospiraceae bacterium]
MMNYIDLPAYDGSMIHVSRIGMGSTMSMERLTTEEKYRLYDYYLEQGGNCIDTARAYSDGHAEEMVGAYLKARKNRDRVIISTKGGHPTWENPEKSRVKREDILGDLETSLRILGTDYADIYWIHKDDESHPIEDIVDTINIIIKQGKARRIGASNFTMERMIAANKYARESGQYGFAASQIQWSLAATEDKYFEQYGSLVMTPERYDYYLENDIPVFAFSSQAQGFFSRVAVQGLEAMPEELRRQYGSEDNMKRLELLKIYAKEHNCSISAPSLGYLINNKLNCVALIGAESIEMLAQSLEAADLQMTAEEADALYEV